MGSATTQGWFSSMIDGSAGAGTDPDYPGAQNAAFAFAWDGDQNSSSAKQTVFQTTANGGPGLSRHQYPSTDGRPATAGTGAGHTPAELDGKLVGMGAGYQSFKGELHTPAGTDIGGVGLTTGGSCLLGNGPVAEGQINLTGLTDGTYKLVLTHGQGNNVLRGDFGCDDGTDGNFAVAANTVTDPAPLSFAVSGCGVVACTKPTISSAVSRKVIGGTNYDIAMDGVTTECRINGITTAVVTFNVDVQAYDGTLGWATAADEVFATNATVTGASIANNVLTISLAGAVDLSCVQIAIKGLSCTSNPNASSVMDPATLKSRMAYCDVNNDGQAASGDITQIKIASGTNTDQTNFRRDVNCDGVVASGDVTQAKIKSGAGSAATCP